MIKVCKNCQMGKNTDDFYLTRGRWLSSNCKECSVKIGVERQRQKRILLKECPIQQAKQRQYTLNARERTKIYRQENIEHIFQVQKEYQTRNKERKRIRDQAWREANRERCRERDKRNRQKNLEQYRTRGREYTRNRRATDNKFRLVTNLRVRVYCAIKQRSESTKDLLGCSIEHFIRHLESQFAPEMTWANYGSYWEIDHVKPCASFDLTDSRQQKICFHWANCQPLGKIDNRRKGAKTVVEPVYSVAIAHSF